MKIKAVLFDLDGTLLPMDLGDFFKEYFKLLSVKLAPYGYEAKTLVKTIWEGVSKVEKNDGSRLNKEVFWEQFEKVYGIESREHRWVLDDFYLNEFQFLKDRCGFIPEAGGAVKEIKKKGLRTAVATKPIFPDEAILSRMRWAGVDVSDFDMYTSYDNSRRCKPDKEYYLEVASKMQLSPEECLMVGNDVSEDMVARYAGMKVFLMTDCLINTEQKDISSYPSGSFADLLKYIDTII